MVIFAQTLNGPESESQPGATCMGRRSHCNVFSYLLDQETHISISWQNGRKSELLPLSRPPSTYCSVASTHSQPRLVSGVSDPTQVFAPLFALPQIVN